MAEMAGNLERWRVKLRCVAESPLSQRCAEPGRLTGRLTGIRLPLELMQDGGGDETAASKPQRSRYVVQFAAKLKKSDTTALNGGSQQPSELHRVGDTTVEGAIWRAAG